MYGLSMSMGKRNSASGQNQEHDRSIWENRVSIRICVSTSVSVSRREKCITFHLSPYVKLK